MLSQIYIIPVTKLVSYELFISEGTCKNIENYILHLLAKRPNLSNRQIHQISGIDIGSLCYPIRSLRRKGDLYVSGKVKNTTGRIAQTYSLTKSVDHVQQ